MNDLSDTSKSTGEARQIYGIDFSGAVDAGKKIWIAEGVLEKGTFLIESCKSIATLPGSGKERDLSLEVLKDFIEESENAVFGLDFPFGLPRPLVKHKTWEEWVNAFPSLYRDPEVFRNACRSFTGGKELKRMTDIESKTPFSPYNLRLYRQTYYGISRIISPLVREHHACVLPMQRPLKHKPWLIEICPASTMMQKGSAHIPYKGRTPQHRKARLNLLKDFEQSGFMRILHGSVRSEVLRDPGGGDALDSLISALAVSKALASPQARSHENELLYTIEGYVYV
jgi:hypothetical protein